MMQQLADWLVYGIFGLDATTPLGTAVNFFFYDSIKIVLLLFGISFVMGIINAYFPIERLRQFLTRLVWLESNAGLSGEWYGAVDDSRIHSEQNAPGYGQTTNHSCKSNTIRQ